MSIDTIIDQKAGVILHTVTERLTMDAIRAAFAAVIADPLYRKDMPAVWDMRSADAAQMSSEKILKIIDFFKGHQEQRSGHKVAIVASNDLTFGLSRMYEFRASELNAEIEVFRDFKKAWRWVTT